MSVSPPPPAPRSVVWALPIAGAAAALLPSIWMWGFTVDDALITVRYARHIACGAGYRFNIAGPATDGVTPLPFAPLLSLLTAGGTSDDLVSILERSKILGMGAWTIAGAVLGHALVGKPKVITAALGLLTMAIAFPIGAWAASGMETGLVIALATVAACMSNKRPVVSAITAGLAAAFRPELIAWALFLSTLAAPPSPRERIRAAALAFGPFLACVVVRLFAFGRPAPLALSAKPSDFSHGVTYGVAATLVILTPFLALGPHWKTSRHAKAIVIAALVHLVVVIAVGGDWMPYARLLVPIAPSLVIAYVEVPKLARLRAAVAIVLGLVLFTAKSGAERGRHVYADRKALITNARPHLASSKVIASLDIGWVAAAANDDAKIVDLAGLTDPEIAALAGGHTSKAVDLGMLLDRQVDTIVMYSARRYVEHRIMRGPLFESRFENVATVPLGTHASYAIYRLKGNP